MPGIRPSKSICGAMSDKRCDPASQRSPPRPTPGLFPPQLVSGIAVPPVAGHADEAATVGVQAVLQGYAQVLQGCLGRSSQTRFDLAGVQLYADVEAILQSVARCCAQHADATLQHWQTVLHDLVTTYRAAFAEVAEAQTWVEALRTVLDSAPLPTAEERGAGADAVAREVAYVLGRLAERTDLSPWLRGVRDHRCGLSER